MEFLLTEDFSRRHYAHNPKSTWGAGPWQSEHDKYEWRDTATGLPCLIVRNDNGALCGYVAVSREHPFYHKSYSICIQGHEDCWQHSLEDILNVHGGITYAASCNKDICHVPLENEPDDVWWFGFDCAHSGDLVPGLRAILRRIDNDDYHRGDIYRDVNYAVAQCTQLAQQLKEIDDA